MTGHNGRPVIVSTPMCVLWSLTSVGNGVAQGRVSFTARQDFRVAGGSIAVTVGDFNGDSCQDLATPNFDYFGFEAGGVSILLRLR